MRVRTEYSFKTAVGLLPEVLSRLQELRWPVAPISDRLSAFSFAPWTKLAAAANLRPIYGVELPVAEDWWTFYAKDDIRLLHNLIAQATSEVGLTYAAAQAANGVIKITSSGTQLDQLMPQPDLYIGLSPALPKALYSQAKVRGFKFIATSDNLYPREGDKEFYRVALNMQANMATYPQHILSDDEWRRTLFFADNYTAKIAIANRDRAFSQCTATLRKASLLVPKKPMTLRAMCIIGAKRLNVNLEDPVYKVRLDHELKMIEEKKFADYFYIIAELVNWAKQRMIVGPARGSSCGSLACYLLNITAIDPIPYGLLFERFIDVTRSDLPDIDIDFSDVNRELVFKHAEEVYGADRVARLGTVSTWLPRSALRIAGPALKIPQWHLDKLLDGLIERMGGDARANQTLEDTLTSTDAGKTLLRDYPAIKLAARMEGHASNAGQHAAGIVITAKPVTEYVAVDMRTKSVMCDKYSAETFNLLKVDALGLKQLSVFERTLELMGHKPISGWLEKNVPLEDAAAFAVLNRGHFAGIFQFTGTSLQAFSKQIVIENFNDMVAMTALARPGPMGTGGTSVWVKRRMGQEQVHYSHAMLEPFLEETHGVVTYQEQVMRIGREIGDLSWADVTALRKAMSKSLGEEYFDQFGVRWKAGATKRGMEKEVADKVWRELCTFGNWGFNKSHAVAYAMVSYWCCWLKAYNPMEFAAATLDAEDDGTRQIKLLRELRDEGVTYVPVDPDRSTDKWQPIKRDGKPLLVGPLSAIKGIGKAKVKQILAARAAKRPLPPALADKLHNPVTPIDSLHPVRDKLKQLYPDGIPGIKTKPTEIKDCQCANSDRPVMIIGIATKIQPKDLNEAINVNRRGGKIITGKYTWALNSFFMDDTDQIFCRVAPFDFDTMGKEIVERGAPGKSIWAIKGVIPRGTFRMISIERIKYLGSMDDNSSGLNRGGTGKAGPDSSPSDHHPREDRMR
jgi:DNA polymerase III alpha subunit